MNKISSLLNQLAAPIISEGLRIFSMMRLPQVQGNISISGITAPVDILRDRWGIPHIFAQNSSDVLFGQGFVHAQERLWQMDFTRRVVAGRLAEVLGEAALPFDRAMRTLGLRRVACLEAGIYSPQFQKLVEAYCSGVNAWINLAIQQHKLPIEFALLGYSPEPWLPADVASWGKLMCWDLATNWQSEFLRGQLVQRFGAEKIASLESDFSQSWAVVLDAGRGLAGGKALDATRKFAGASATEGAGSNNWVVHGSRTASGMPLLANDMHLGLTAPAIWYENHLCGGALNVTGVSFAGVPMVVAGHNRQVAWGFTDGMADVQDLYEEHLRRNAAGAWEYEFCGEWLSAEVRQEEIRIKGGKSTVEEVITTRHGPVINALFKEAFPDAPNLALRWTSLQPERLLEAFYAMNTATGCADFHQALREFTSPVQNVVYADTSGNIAYTLPGNIPIRSRGDGTLPSPAWTGEYEWNGYIPFEELPHLENPARGFIASANNPVSRSNSPHLISRDFVTCDRAARITELLLANERVDPAYFQKMHLDQVSWSARSLGTHLGRLETTDNELAEMIRQFHEWDGSLTVDSSLALVYQATIREAIRMILQYHLEDLGGYAQGKGYPTGFWGDHAQEWFINLLERRDSPWFNLGHGETRDEVLLRALRRAVDCLKSRQGAGAAAWNWGQHHQITFDHILGAQKPLDAAFNLGSYPIGGDSTTIWASMTHMYDLEPARVIGPPFRFIARLDDLDHCLGLLTPGQSGHIASRHYRDGLKPWFEGQYHTMYTRREEIEANLEAKLVLRQM